MPYEAALTMPESFALALLTGGRPHNTRPIGNDVFKTATEPSEPEVGRRLVATRRVKQDKL